ncbi:MAG TPA: family 1 glycosylhydrolase, partial [Anaerolineales bacterium]|nr:family 1 glycosylhydrolase [Anaerolineales bacterium]
AALVVERYSDRVTHWMTHNEPQCFVWLGHSVGVHAPGDKLGWAEVLRVGHNALLAHGRAVQAMRAAAKQPIQIGFAPVSSQAMPADPNNPADVDAARQATFAVRGQDFWNNTWFSDPIFLKRYPEDGVALYGDAMPAIGADDFEIIGQPIDFYGANIYQGVVVRAGANGPELVPFPDGYPHTAFPWPVTPEALYWGPRFLYERYKTPIYITENGLASMDWVGIDQRVHDRGRIDFTTRYLAELHRAIKDGVDVRGYFHWSLLDNFEWAEGYKQRFGLVHVDFATLKRTPKDSFVWYQGVVRANGF